MATSNPTTSNSSSPAITQTTLSPTSFKTTTHLPIPPSKVLTYLHTRPDELLNLHPWMTPCIINPAPIEPPTPSSVKERKYHQSEYYSFFPVPRRWKKKLSLHVKITSTILDLGADPMAQEGGLEMEVEADCIFGKTVLRMRWEVSEPDVEDEKAGRERAKCMVTEEVGLVSAPRGGRGLAVRQARKAHELIFGKLGEALG